jgi:hypothetical protein
MIADMVFKDLESQLNHFSYDVRNQALNQLNRLHQQEEIAIQSEQDAFNLHVHSFFSYNAYGLSPTALAWLAKKNGYRFMGLVDFDILDGVDEFLSACEQLGVRGVAGVESRVFIPEFSQLEINSPGEPGVAYHMGTGLVSSSVPASAEPALKNIRSRAEARNRQMLEKINQFLSPMKLDYEADILPLTPSGYATERHMVQKITQKADQTLDDPIRFWQKKLDQPVEDLERLFQDRNNFHNLLRKKLMKRGGVGYRQPDEGTFPSVDSFHAVIDAANAIPCSAWLDGTSKGEQDIERLLTLLIDKGVSALNIVPDRNWNISDPELKAQKLDELYHIVQLADELTLPILIGTEMNSYGQKMVDDFNAPELASIKDSFTRGAYFIYGHTRMERLWGMGYRSDWIEKHLTDRKSKNDYYEKVGHLIPPNWKSEKNQARINPHQTPEQVIKSLEEMSN